MGRSIKDDSIMLTKKEFITNKVKLVTDPDVKGKILRMYSSNPNNDSSYPLMYEKEKKIIKQRVRELCEKYNPKKVLEIGFGLGYTATEFQECGVEEHIIVEAHPEVFKDAEQWAKKYPNVKLVNKFIQDYKYNEDDYDLILDDRFEMVHDLNEEVTPRYKAKNEWKMLYTEEDKKELTK